MEAAFARSLEEQYAAAARRYSEVSELLAEVQNGYFVDEWEDSGVGADFVPMGGEGFAPFMSGASNDNSYVFRLHRYHAVEGSLEALIQRVADDWRERGWETKVSGPFAGYSRVATVTPGGFSLTAQEDDGMLTLIASSPAYWGDPDALAAAVIERGEAESAAGVHGSKYARVDGFARLLPGAYRPFPAWDALEKYPPVTE